MNASKDDRFRNNPVGDLLRRAPVTVALSGFLLF
ncbi:hypothetical protein J3A64_004670, partial [Pseudarthrobacter sp. PvP004]|nr:hypothetical protein [Pseudarthrobacter sp. PvP004]